MSQWVERRQDPFGRRLVERELWESACRQRELSAKAIQDARPLLRELIEELRRQGELKALARARAIESVLARLGEASDREARRLGSRSREPK